MTTLKTCYIANFTTIKSKHFTKFNSNVGVEINLILSYNHTRLCVHFFLFNLEALTVNNKETRRRPL